MEKIRIQKIIADSGYCSRRRAEEYMEAGAVKVNGRPVSVGDKADPKNDLITVSGEKIKTGATLHYIKMYKPRGYVTTMSDKHDMKLITELLGGISERVYPVGRLDRTSEGIILLTNDGVFANEIMHPRGHIEKTYRVTIPQIVSEETIARMSAGIDIGDCVTLPCVINTIVSGSRNKPRTVLEFIIHEGKNRQIRRMCEAAGLSVSRLRRTSVGGVKLGMMKPGEYADLTREELTMLRGSFKNQGKQKPENRSRRNDHHSPQNKRR